MTLLPEVLEDPANASALERSEVLRNAMGPMLFDAFIAVRRAKCGAFARRDPEAIASVHRWRY